jgi:hypothetical protein
LSAVLFDLSAGALYGQAPLGESEFARWHGVVLQSLEQRDVDEVNDPRGDSNYLTHLPYQQKTYSKHNNLALHNPVQSASMPL